MPKANFHHVVKGPRLVLVSYQTPVAALDQVTGELFVTEKKFSVTTSRHISQFRKFCNYPTVVNTVSQAFIETLFRE